MSKLEEKISIEMTASEGGTIRTMFDMGDFGAYYNQDSDDRDRHRFQDIICKFERLNKKVTEPTRPEIEKIGKKESEMPYEEISGREYEEEIGRLMSFNEGMSEPIVKIKGDRNE